MKEKEIQKIILEWLKWKKIFHYKSNNVGIFKRATGSYIPSGVIGLPDIICVVDGRYVGIEVKAKYGKQSEGQKAFQENLEKAGGLYFLVYSLEELMNLWRKQFPKIHTN